VFKAQWATTVPEQHATFEDQTIIITGANSGLGLETARYMLTHKAARVIIACRNVLKGNEAKKSLEAKHGRKGVLEVWELDLASYPSVKAFVAKATQDLDRIDVLICNAGIHTLKLKLINELESQIAVNVVSTFLLSLLLLPKLKQTGGEHPETIPHLAIVSSDTHMAVTLNKQHTNKTTPILTQLSDKRKFFGPFSYPISKLLNVLMTIQLAKHVGTDHPVIINTMNPGLCKSDLTRDAPSLAIKFTNFIFHVREPEVGVRSYIFGVQGGRELHGKYISDGVEGELGIGAKGPKAEEVGERVWAELIEILEKVEPGIMSKL
jgi:NAD(P)-dependent dehydrogenase (short-subunit alcohol dehydrogenase family)